MSLYLCIFREDEEIEGVEVGSYDDFGRFRDTVAAKLENGHQGSRFPILQLHPDSDGQWTVDECRGLTAELERIQKELSRLPPATFAADQEAIAEELNLVPRNLSESFIDIDGEHLLSRLIDLCRLAMLGLRAGMRAGPWHGHRTGRLGACADGEGRLALDLDQTG